MLLHVTPARCQVSDIRRFWDDEMVGFLLGCSFTWEGLLEQHGLTPRHIEQRVNVSMYKTKLRNERRVAASYSLSG